MSNESGAVAPIDFAALQDFFEPDAIEWRLQQAGEKNGRVWAMCVPYVTNRAIQVRLDEVAGPDRWRNEFLPGPDGGVMCGLSIRVGNEWVTKWDGAENTDVEGVKGGLSGAMKRAAVQWGIGRYLYALDELFANVHENGRFRGKTREGNSFRWDPPPLPKGMLPHPRAAPVPTAAVPQAPAVTLASDAQLTDLRSLAARVGRKAGEWLAEKIEQGIPADAVPNVFRSLQEQLEAKQARKQGHGASERAHTPTAEDATALTANIDAMSDEDLLFGGAP